MQPKTIISYLVDGNPQGIKTVELSNRIGKAISIPRAKLKEAKNRQETQQPALYFLFGKDDDENELAYIGEAENLINRIANHDSNKNFRETVIAFISKDNNLTKADVKFLEAKAIEQAKKVNRYQLENSTSPVPNNLPEYQESSILEFLSNINLLIAAMGHPILKEIKKDIDLDEKIYYLTARGSDARGIYTEDGFLVLKGSKGPSSMTKSEVEKKQYAYRNRPKLLKQGIIKEDGEDIVFLQDYLFPAPSSASQIIVGNATNGRLVRKDKNGKTLDENERKQLNS